MDCIASNCSNPCENQEEAIAFINNLHFFLEMEGIFALKEEQNMISLKKKSSLERVSSVQPDSLSGRDNKAFFLKILFWLLHALFLIVTCLKYVCKSSFKQKILQSISFSSRFYILVRPNAAEIHIWIVVFVVLFEMSNFSKRDRI